MPNPYLIALTILAAGAATILLADEAEAHTSRSVANVQISSGGAGNRCHWLGNNADFTANDWRDICSASPVSPDTVHCHSNALGNSPCTQSNLDWTYNAGDCITLRYADAIAGVPTNPAPTHYELLVALDAGTTLITLHDSGSVPAATHSFCFTDTGTAAGTPTAGVFRLFVRVEADNGLPTDYDESSESDGHVGVLRSRMVVSSCAASTPPSGSHFAAGPAGDESVTITVSHTKRSQNRAQDTVRINTIRGTDSALIETGTTKQVGETSTAQAFVIDLTYDAALETYGCRFEILGNGIINNGFGGEDAKWTVFATTGHGAGITRESATSVRHNDVFDADPRLTCSTDGTTTNNQWTATETVYNRGESPTLDGYVLNSRNQQLTRSLTIEVRSQGGTLVDSSIQAGPNYSLTYAIAATDPATKTPTGDQHFVRPTGTDLTQDCLATHGVSRLYYVDAHPQISPTLAKDDFPTDDANEILSYHIAADLLNAWVHVEGVRLDGTEIDTSGAAVTWDLRRPGGNSETSGTTDTLADGWSPLFLEHAPGAPAGDWVLNLTVSFNGNAGQDDETLTFVSPATSDLAVLVLIDPTLNSDGTYTIKVLTEQSGAATTPDTLPNITITWVDKTTSPWVVVKSPFRTNTTNTADWTETINGGLYVYNWTAPGTLPFEDGKLEIMASGAATINGSPIFGHSNGVVEEMLTFDGHDLAMTLEFVFWFGWFVYVLKKGSLVMLIPTVLGMGRYWFEGWAAEYNLTTAIMLFSLLLILDAFLISQTVLENLKRSFNKHRGESD